MWSDEGERNLDISFFRYDYEKFKQIFDDKMETYERIQKITMLLNLIDEKMLYPHGIYRY